MDIEDVKSRITDPDIDPQRVLDMYQAPFARAMGIELVSVGKDGATCTMELLPTHLNSMGRGHGAAVYALMDHAFAIASNAYADGTGQSTEVKFYRPVHGKLTAVAKVINKSRSLEIFDVRVTSEEGKLIASAVCTAFILRKRF
ncbi:MAG: PaaI family thioesterase [Candidatus Methanomethylophilaceae archaeon]|nr:PaaI family thioesterase [Candidatus Methanomethylophilaceae archaeon]